MAAPNRERKTSVTSTTTFFATLTCSGNNPPPNNAGSPNTGPSKLGQCAGL